MAAADAGSCSSSRSLFSLLEEENEAEGRGGAGGLLAGGFLCVNAAVEVEGEGSRPKQRKCVSTLGPFLLETHILITSEASLTHGVKPASS